MARKEPPKQKSKTPGFSRRGLLAAAGAVSALPLVTKVKAAEANTPGTKPEGPPYNVILIVTDEESYALRPAEGYSLPAREELMRRGTTFERHYIGAAMCTPSRGVMFSGQPPQVNGVFDQMELGYVPSLRRDRPSIGTVFKALGYETAYFGKFELKRSIIKASDEVNYTTALQDYGFDRFAPDGDKVGAPDQGYDTDAYTAAEAIRWLRSDAQRINAEGKPWLLVVSFVSPHDIMYGLMNQPGQDQQVSAVGQPLNPPPANSHFRKRWSFPPSPSALQPMDTPGRPRAQLSYMVGWSAFLGEIPTDAAAMWKDYYNYYLNLIQDNDRTLLGLLDALSALDLWNGTVVMRTADHGELAGSHGGLRGKGPLPYEEESHVPAVIVHPAHPGGRRCRALTSHIDLLPTLAGLTGTPAEMRKPLLAGLPGRDASPLLQDPEAAAADALRPAVLFNYVGLQTIDSLYMIRVCRAIAAGKWAPPFSEAKPDLTRRGFINFVFDGRYKFARYFAPLEVDRTQDYATLSAHYEMELFDLENDPHELENLAMREDARPLLLRMNALLNRMLEQEVGPPTLDFLPADLRQA